MRGPKWKAKSRNYLLDFQIVWRKNKKCLKTVHPWVLNLNNLNVSLVFRISVTQQCTNMENCGNLNRLTPCIKVWATILRINNLYIYIYHARNITPTNTFTFTTVKIWVQLFKNGPSKICGRQFLKNLKRYVPLSRP